MILFLLVTAQWSQAQRYYSDATIDSLRTEHKQEFKKALITSGALIGGGLIALTDNNFFSDAVFKEARDRNLSGYRTHIDDYIQYAPIVAVYGLNLSGVKGENNFMNRSLLLLKSEALATVVTHSLKYVTSRTRPDGSEDNSFPSGHTTQAFVAATFMHKEFGDESIWYSIGAYATASAVGTFRVLNNRHWTSDVLVGAGIGIFCTELVYATHQYRWFKNEKIQWSFLPSYSGKQAGVYMKLQF